MTGMIELDRDIARVGRIDAVTTILDVICKMTGLGFAAVARVTDDRWIACKVKDEIAFGLEVGGELPILSTLCHEVHQVRQPIVIDEVAVDPCYREHHTPATYGFQSYISMPITLADGRFFGTLCAIGPQPAALKRPEVVNMFRLFAHLIAVHLDMIERMEAGETALQDERETSALREQFIAVLGHDLRNPLAAVESGVRLLRHENFSDRGTQIVGMMQQSVRRMTGLVDNIMDFARGRLGGGITLEQRQRVAVVDLVQQCIDELQASQPARQIEARYQDGLMINGDPSRLLQLFSNLIANALTHGAEDQVVKVSAIALDSQFAFTVTNGGEPIPPAAMGRLFQPFDRSQVGANQQGLGLGLYISSEIAKAHGGTLSVESSRSGTCFTFTMPLD